MWKSRGDTIGHLFSLLLLHVCLDKISIVQELFLREAQPHQLI